MTVWNPKIGDKAICRLIEANGEAVGAIGTVYETCPIIGCSNLMVWLHLPNGEIYFGFDDELEPVEQANDRP